MENKSFETVEGVLKICGSDQNDIEDVFVEILVKTRALKRFTWLTNQEESKWSKIDGLVVELKVKYQDFIDHSNNKNIENEEFNNLVEVRQRMLKTSFSYNDNIKEYIDGLLDEDLKIINLVIKKKLFYKNIYEILLLNLKDFQDQVKENFYPDLNLDYSGI